MSLLTCVEECFDCSRATWNMADLVYIIYLNFRQFLGGLPYMR
jgi:hypothetical protein